MDQEQAELNRRSSTYDSGDGNSSEEIRRQIDRRRADMDQVANALAARLNPHQLADEVATAVKRKLASRGERVRMALYDSVKENPVPWLLVGGGLGWMIVRARQRNAAHSSETALALPSDFDGSRELLSARERSGYSEPGDSSQEGVLSHATHSVAEATSHAKDRIVDATDKAKEKLVDAKEKVAETKERMSDAMDHVGEMRQQVMTKASDSFDSNPLLLGGIALGVGALIGLAIPTTTAEDRLMGETRDRLLDTAREKGNELVDRGKEMAGKVSQVASAVVSTTTDEVSHAQGGSVKQEAANIVRSATETAKEEARRQGLVADSSGTGGDASSSFSSGSLRGGSSPSDRH